MWGLTVYCRREQWSNKTGSFLIEHLVPPSRGELALMVLRITGATVIMLSCDCIKMFARSIKQAYSMPSTLVSKLPLFSLLFK